MFGNRIRVNRFRDKCQIEAAVEVADRFNTQDLLPDQRRRIAENWLLSTAVETAPDGVEQAY